MIDREALAKHLHILATEGAEPTAVLHKVTIAEIVEALTHVGEGAVPVGWPTVEMCRAYYNTVEERPLIFQIWRLGFLAALAAAPHPPRQDGAREVEAVAWNCIYPTYGHFTLKKHEADQAIQDGAIVCALIYADTTPPAPDEAVEAELNLDDYHSAPSGIGPLAYTWQDKPHRLLYDLIKALRLQRARSRRDVGGGV